MMTGSSSKKAAHGRWGAEEDFKLWVLLHHTAVAVEKVRQKELKQHGLNVVRYNVLYYLQSMGSQPTPAEISRWIFRRPHTISGLLDRMEREGLVERTKDKNRKNMIRVALTEKGREAYSNSGEMESLHKIMSSLSKKHRGQLISYLRKLRNKSLEDAGYRR